LDVQIRKAVAADVPAMAEIERQSFAQPWSQASLQSALDDGRNVVLVGAIDGALLGCANGWCIGDEAEISRLAVLQRERRHGIGAKLLGRLLEELAKLGAARVFLEVRTSNVAALRLYENAGFLQVGLRRRYYEDGEDAIIMSLELAGVLRAGL